MIRSIVPSYPYFYIFGQKEEAEMTEIWLDDDDIESFEQKQVQSAL